MKAKLTHILSLSYSLAKANFKLRNEASYLGILWYLLNPLSFFLIILYVRSALFSDDGIAHYPVYLLLGLIMLNFFSQAMSASIGLIRNNAGFIKSIKVPYEVFVVSTIFQAIFSHIFELILLAVLLAYFHISLLGIVWYIPVFILFAAFTLGWSFLAATIGLYFNDLKNIWAIAAQLLLFATPVFYAVYPGSAIYSANMLNPLFYFLTSARDVALYGTVPSAKMLAALLALSIFALAIGLSVFKRYKSRFAEFV